MKNKTKIFDIISVSNDSYYNTRAQSKLGILTFYTRTKKIGNTFFPFCIKEWNQLNTKIRNLPFISRFKKLPLVYLQNDENSICDVHNPIDIKLLNRLRVNFSHLHKHKFRHNFRDTVNPFCLCNGDTETISHYLLGCPLFFEQRTKLLESLSSLAKTLLNHCDDDIVLLFSYMDHLNIAFLRITKYCHLLLTFQNLRNILTNGSF